MVNNRYVQIKQSNLLLVDVSLKISGLSHLPCDHENKCNRKTQFEDPICYKNDFTNPKSDL